MPGEFADKPCRLSVSNRDKNEARSTLWVEYLHPSFAHVNSLVVNLYEQLVRSEWKQDLDLYVRRGGHFVIRMLQDCYATNGITVPALGVDSSRYTGLGETSTEIRVSLPAELVSKGKRILVVDDVADDGSTLGEVKAKLTEKSGGDVEIRFLTLYKKPWSKMVPDYWAEETDRWIVFPWEPYEVLGQIVKRQLPMDDLVLEIRKAGFGSNDIAQYLRVIQLLPGKNAQLRSKTEAIQAYFSPPG
ncbi:MAG: phosphoribosyltransferase family protein [Thaumarchaeota archaeon]|nr:phosphoribosyltransferase family protein [Nitrososphaerota archaeon]